MNRLLALICLGVACGSAAAQSLAEVLSSIQERKLVLEQAQAIIRSQGYEAPYYTNFYPGGPANSFELIQWSGCPAFPVNNDLSGASIERHVRLLNEAIHHFCTVRAGFLNVAEERLVGTSGAQRPAVLRRFDELSLPAPEFANHLNYQRVLRELACKVDALRVTPWPVDCTLATESINTPNPVPDGNRTTGIDKIKWDEMNTVDYPSCHFHAPEEPVIASFRVGGHNYLTNSGSEQYPVWHPHEVRRAERVWPSSFTWSLGPANQLPPGVAAVEGSCVMLARTCNTPYLGAVGTGASSTPVPLDGRYNVLETQTSPCTATVTAPQWAVSGTWVDAPEGTDDGHRFKPDSSSATGYDAFFSGGGELYACVKQEIVFVLIPSFTKGLNQSNTGNTWDRPRTPGSPGALAVSGGAAKLSVDVGRGESMDVAGAIQLQHCWTAYPDFQGYGIIVAPTAFPRVLWAHPNESLEYLDYFTDRANHHQMPTTFGSHLVFNGPERDFKVFYETRFGHGRAPLKDWPGTSLNNPNYGWQHGMAYYWEWNEPRLRQVLGREALVNITAGDDDYSPTISVYRIPEGHTIIYDEDGFVKLTGLLPLKDVALANPTLSGETGFPEDPLAASVTADGGVWSIEGTNDGLNLTWSVSLKKSDSDAVIASEVWNATTDFGLTSVGSWTTGYPVAFEAPVCNSLSVARTLDGGDQGTVTHTLAPAYSLKMGPLPRVLGSTLVVANESTAATVYGYSEDDEALRFPTTITSNVSNEPQTVINIALSGLPDLLTRGAGAAQWQIDWEVQQSGCLKETTSYGGSESVIGRKWTTWENDGTKVTVYSAPDGSVDELDAPATDWLEIEYGHGSIGVPGLPHKLKRKNGNDTSWAWAWTTGANPTMTVEIRDGQINTNGGLTNGTKTVLTTNSRGYVSSTATFLVQGNDELKVAGCSTPAGQFTLWGAPLKSVDYPSGLASSWTFDGNRDRLATINDTLNNASAFSAFDPLGRLTGYSWNDHVGTNTPGALGVANSLVMGDGVADLSTSRTWDAMGRVLTDNESVGGVTREWGATYGGNTASINTYNSLTKASTTTILDTATNAASATGNVLPFGGVTAPAIAVEDHLIRTRTEIKGHPGIYQSIWIDAWGRVRKTETPSTKSGETDTTEFVYSDPGSPIRRVTTLEPSGRRTIQESDPHNSAGVVICSGLDLSLGANGEYSLESGDRYVRSVTTIVSGKLHTEVTASGEPDTRAILVTDTDPATGIVTSILNPEPANTGGEESVTREPTYLQNKVTVTSSKGWKKTDSFNSLGLLLSSSFGNDDTASGHLATDITATRRDDGSLATATQTTGRNAAPPTTTASFGNNGLLTALSVPILGDIFGEHGFDANGGQTLTLGGTSNAVSADGTTTSVTGGDIMSQSRNLSVDGSTFTNTITPAAGAVTVVARNAAGAETTHDYITDDDITTVWNKGWELAAVSCARGGSTSFEYFDDGARDLESVTYPAVGSSSSITEEFTYYPSGKVKTITDPSGSRLITYDRGHLWQSTYVNTAKPLDGYEVERVTDDAGRCETVTVKYNGTAIHSYTNTFNGSSDEISGVTANGFSCSYARTNSDTRAITGVTRGDVEQAWGRGTAGRITSAGSSISEVPIAGAPSFAYTEFDAKGRRKKCTTAGFEWEYTYGTAGQLIKAEHLTLGTFNYPVDGIGRRTGSGNSLLNCVTALAHSQQKQLVIAADPDAVLSVNGVPQTPVDGKLTYDLGLPAAAGRWESWSVTGVLADAGDHAPNADAVAEMSGHVWVPPSSESFTYDADGNRKSSSLWDYGWDGRNMLASASTRNYGNSPEGWRLTFDYDAEGRRFKKNITHKTTKDGHVTETQENVTFVWDGWTLVYERHDNQFGRMLYDRKYVWGEDIGGGRDGESGAGGAGGLLLIRETRGQAASVDYYPLYDGSGHVVGLTDSAGTLVAEYTYAPFGELISASGPMADANPIRYATKYFDKETGFYYYGRRYYDPATGQWLSREPLGEDESLNLYAYCHNDPVNRVDVLGSAPAGLNPEQSKIFDELLAKWPISERLNADITAKILGIMRMDGYLDDSRLVQAARLDVYETQVGDVYRKNPALINTVGGIADAAMHMIPGSGPQGAGAVDGSNTTFMLAVDTFRLFGGSLIAMDPGSPRSFRDEVFPGFVKGYNAQYSYGQRTGAEIGTLFASFIAPQAKLRVGEAFSGLKGSRFGEVLNPSFAGRLYLARGSVLNPLAAKGAVGKTIGLGLEEDLVNLRGTGAITYKNGGWQQAGLTTVEAGRATEPFWFRRSFDEASKNASAIRFDVSSFSPAYPKPGLTSWELNQILKNPSLLGKTTFIQNGQQVIWNGVEFVRP